MIARLFLGLTIASLAACADEPTPKEAEQAANATIAEDTADAVKTQKKSIEEAADAAVKLIEEESRQEIEENARAEDTQTNDQNEIPETQKE